MKGSPEQLLAWVEARIPRCKCGGRAQLQIFSGDYFAVWCSRRRGHFTNDYQSLAVALRRWIIDWSQP